MFFNTPNKLLRPIHSLLKDPFSFSAESSISGNLFDLLSHRTDFSALLAMGCLYDKAKIKVQGSLVGLRPLLESGLSVSIPATANLTQVCHTEFKGSRPQFLGLDGARYLSHVSVQCQIERLYDLMELRRAGTKNALEEVGIPDVVCFLMFSEALAICLAGIAMVKQTNGHFELSTTDKRSQETLRNTWFARIADQGGHAGTLVLAKNLAQSGAVTVQDVEPLTNRILDQDLSIPWNMVTQQCRALESVQHIYAAAALVAVLIVIGFRNETVKMTSPRLAEHKLNFSAVSSLLCRQGRALVTDQFVTRNGSDLAVRIEGFSKGLRQYFRLLEEEFGERDALRDHIGGFFFEKTRIRLRIEDGDDYKPRYRVIEGFSRDKVIGGVPNECDVEFIIHDLEQNHYYFVQAKHAILGEKAFFNSVVEALQKDIGKGIHQLREAKYLLEHNQLNSTLYERGIDDATPKNSSFVLLHNIAQFDYQSTDDGISLYDWATFRNLLKDAECEFGSSNGRRELMRLPSPLVMRHPTDVIQRLLREHPAYRSVYGDPWATERATTSYSILGKKIRITGLGI